MLKIGELAEISGVTVRTLQYYDRIWLLIPGKDPANGYRLYDEAAVDRLQEILLLRELGIELVKIREILEGNDYHRLSALKEHRRLTRLRIQELERLDRTIESSIAEMEKGIRMKNKDKFKGIDFRNNPYEKEAKERWGKQVEESQAHIAGKSDDELKNVSDRMNDIFREFAAMRDKDPKSPESELLCGRFHRFLNEEVGSFYNKEVFAGLAQMYVDDERFTANLDQWGEGTAQFMKDAMTWYAEKFL